MQWSNLIHDAETERLHLGLQNNLHFNRTYNSNSEHYYIWNGEITPEITGVQSILLWCKKSLYHVLLITATLDRSMELWVNPVSIYCKLDLYNALAIKWNNFLAIFSYFWSLVHMTGLLPFSGKSGKMAITPSFSTFSSPRVYLLTAPSWLNGLTTQN